jgi:hypothetical protein
VGFAGLAEAVGGTPGHTVMAGRVIDRLSLFDHGPSDRAVSIDEMAVALHADTPLRADPTLPWHLWATDLCIQARQLPAGHRPRILDVPLFHNSVTDFQLPQAFHDCANRLMAKHPSWPEIPTLCGTLRRAPALAVAL